MNTHSLVRQALTNASQRASFRIVHYSLLRNHLHLVCEADGRDALSRGIQGLCVRLARGLNRWWVRIGAVFPDRFHSRVLRTPREVRNALAYVLHNAHHYHIDFAEGLDPFSSAAWFDGWQARERAGAGSIGPSLLARARTWLLAVGWKRHGLLASARARKRPS